MKLRNIATRVVFASVVLGLPALAHAGADMPTIAYVPRTSPPPVPEGLNVTCANAPNFTALAKNCPIIRYEGMTTWVFSYKDNRWSMALVTYDQHNKVVRNVEQKGARYIVNAISSPKTRTVTISGQDARTITVPWSELGK